jgi:cytochrome c oxidase cbb3-type subunit 2
MKGFGPLFLGIFGTFAFSWLGMIVVPNWQIGHLDPQSDEEGTDIYPMPQSGMVERGRHIYVANGCFYCHTQQVRADYAASDIERGRDYSKEAKWGQRRSAPRDYIFDRPVTIGKERLGPDLANVGKAAPGEGEAPANTAAPTASASPSASPAASATPSASPAASTSAPSPSPSSVPTTSGEAAAYSAAWHHRHLYSPRSVSADSNMPAFRYLYEKRPITGERSADALVLTGRDAVPDGWEVVPSYEAKCLVAYLMALDQSHPLKEIKGAGGAAPAPAPATAPSPAAQPAAPAAPKK